MAHVRQDAMTKQPLVKEVWINNEDQREFNKIVETVRPMYNESSGRIAWGGGIMGVKSQAMMAKRQKALDKELGGRMALA